MPGLRGACQERWTRRGYMHTDAKRYSSGGRRSGGQSNLHRGSQRSKAKGTIKVQDDLSQDLLHPAWRWQCRRLHSATRQQRRVSCGTHTNIYVSGEMRNRSQSLTTIQRTHTTKIKTTSTPSWSEGIEVKNRIVKVFLSFIFSIL